MLLLGGILVMFMVVKGVCLWLVPPVKRKPNLILRQALVHS